MTTPAAKPASDLSDAIVVIAHGSRNAAANTAHHDVCARLAATTERAVYPAFLELAEPSLDAAVTTAAAAGHLQIRVLPLFLYPGRHSREDIPRLIELAAASHPEVELSQMPMFGDDPDVIDLLARQIRT